MGLVFLLFPHLLDFLYASILSLSCVTGDFRRPTREVALFEPDSCRRGRLDILEICECDLGITAAGAASACSPASSSSFFLLGFDRGQHCKTAGLQSLLARPL